MTVREGTVRLVKRGGMENRSRDTQKASLLPTRVGYSNDLAAAITAA